uniref:PH domain-containing protein n=2 Tax=Cyprinus carpio TaxID=7962 RepID=A0A8C2IX39_CYPCA
MGEQLMCKLNPTSDLVKKQLAQIRDQWNALKQTAANHIKAMGGAKTLQEFNKKVDRLEAWIKEKEQEQSLASILGENADKMQLTRKILDLKQDEQLYHNLHEEINHMALRLEKQGKAEGKTISTRRKHINKMWLKAQSHLKEYHENLQLALEVSSFYQQADNIVCSISNMKKTLSASNGVENARDGEIRDIASQIMMLDVSVSQLSNLHPALAARVTQKQSEVKDCWAILQKTLRNEKAAPLPSDPSLTRDTSDPVTPSQEPPGSVGTDPHRIMGKEVKEEQNRLKGFTAGRDTERYGKPSDSRDAGEMAALKLHTASESGNAPRPESSGHTPLHTQLQKFTVSADKTLSWLKDSVAMATQICSLAGPNGFEAAKRRQASLEQDILSNRARIELVKKEGYSLVRAQHPGSIKIQEFLSQLEVLWDELKRRHERNGLVLKVSEELNCRVVRMLQSLASLQAWLEAVELSIRQASLAGDPESVSVAEQESCQLEQELEARRLELQNLRQEVDYLSSQRHLHTQLLPARLKDVEMKFSSVQMALTQQSSELKDTRMLTDFLEKLELEESHYSTLGQPLCGELDSGPSLLGLPVSRHDEPLMEAIGNPVKELREAVEMLNDTARERGRSQSHDQSIQELITRHAMVSAHVEQCLQRCAELAVDVLEIESEMAVRCEPDRCGLDDLQEYQDQLEAEYRVLKEEVEAMVSLASCLSDVCPERMNAVGTEIQTSLNAWDELGKSVAENKKRLLQFGHLRHFFRNYLAMISWTEDTRSCIFSESALRQSRENQEPLVEVLDRQIEQKFEEFDQLAVAGKKLFDDEHHLNKMIRERVEELRSMLGWILVHWRAQKDQLLSRQKTEEAQTDAIYSEAMVCSPQTQLETSPEVSQKRTESLTSAPPGDTEDGLQHSYGYEVMQSVSPKGSDDSGRLERPDSPYLVLKEPSPSALGGTVNLILSFSNSGDTQIQVQAPGREGGVPVLEPVHRPAESHSSACKSFWKRCQGLFGSLKRKTKIYQHSAEEVSTYLHVTENNTAVYESMALPQDKAPRPSSSSPRTLYALSSPCTSPYSSSSIKDTLQQANNLLPKNGNISIFSSLKRKSKKARKKKDDRRHTIQKIMGEDLSEQDDLPPVREPVTYDTHTWPLKERKKRKNARKPKSDGTQVLDYIKNPLVKDIDAECSGEVGSPVHSTLEVATQGHVKNHCRFLSLGSVLSFDLPKDMSLIPSIQDVITIGPPEQKKTDSHHQDTQVDRPTALSTFKTVRSCPMQKEEPKQISPGELTLKIECKDSKKISIDTVSFTEDEFPPPPSPVVEDISFEENHPSSVSNLTNIQQKHLSGISIVPKEEMVSWKANGTQLENKENHYVSVPEDAIQGVALTMAEIHVCPSDHTLVHNLNGHVFHRPVKNSSTQQLSPSHASHVVLNFRANGREDSVDSGHSSSGSFKLCAEGPYIDSSDCPVPKRTTGKVPSLDAGVSTKNFEFSKDKNITLSFDIDAPVHPDHQQFEQEEEELEDIWNHTNSHRESLNSDIMYNGYQATSSLDQHREPSPKEQAVLFRKLVTASAPNLLVAEFRLPPSVQTMVGSGKQQNPREERQILDKGDRRSWAAFTQQEQVYKQVSLNETASDMVKLPEIQDQQKYIYHYREEEEEEEGEEKETGFLKDQSMSLLSVHMGLDWTSDNVIQSGRQELELPSMEGTLERKQKLQLGGKKASCRAWNSYHAVLYKQTICFYQDRKDTLKSCMTSLPLNLIGAVCEPSPEYTKKPNCFCLRLRDGSEYLLSASSRFMMKKWILRIQAHTASSDSVVNRSTCHGSSASAALPRHSPAITGCQCGDKCHCSMRNYVTSTVLAQSQPTSGRTKEIIVHTSDALQIHQRHQDLLLPSFSDAGHCEDEFDSHGESLRQKPSSVSTVQGWTSEKRRSHSFTSATYQRIKPVAPPSGKGQDSSSSYSVTLFIGDREMPSVSKSTATASSNCARQESFSDLPMRSYMSLPRPPNKSVFRKFFGKKE